MTDYLKKQNERNASLLAQGFAGWERRLRGWQLWDYAVELEPVFCPIRPPVPPVIAPANDDARVPGGFGRSFGRNQPPRQIVGQTERTPLVAQGSENSTQQAFYRSETLVELPVLLPKDFEISPAVGQQFFLSLDSFPGPAGFEILADAESVIVQMVGDRSFAFHLKNQLQTFFPNAFVSEKQAGLQTFFANQNNIAIADFGLARSFLLPLQCFRQFNPDPLTGLISSLGNLRSGEKAVFQVLLQKARANWAEEVQKLLNVPNIKSCLGNQIALLREKLSSPLFAAVIRLAAETPHQAQSWEVIRRVGGSLGQFSIPEGNELIALSNDALSSNNHFLSLLSRTTYRSGMLLNAAELASLAHLPSGSVKVERLSRLESDSKPAPDLALNHSFVLGMNEHQGDNRQVTLSNEQRTKHMHLVGASGSGKSTHLLQMMLQDLTLGNGFACFDPHGDLIDAVLERVTESRLKDVILFDPADEDFPIGFNILAAHSELEKTLLSSDLVSIFRRFSTSWGDVMNSILANSVLAFLESTRGGNLLDLKRFLIERSFREDFLKTVQDEEIRYYWQVEFPQIKGKPFAPLLTRLDTFLRSKLIRYIVAQKENRLDFRSIMDERKILLVRLSLGAIGEENAYLLGTLLVSKLYHATLSRQNVSEKKRPPFFLYLDEAHHFITESMNQILTGVRKYKLGLVLAHQQLRQFQAGAADILASVLSNCFTRICFRLEDTDADRLAKSFSFFTADHLKNLGVGEAIVRLEQSRYDFNLKTVPPEPVDAETAEKRKNQIIEQTRKNYGKPRLEIEAEKVRQNPNVIVPDQTEQNIPVQNQGTISPPNTQLVQKTKTSKGFQQIEQGRGGRHHQELQSVIKRMAENYGFQVETEKSVLEGKGFVDVSLEKEDLRIACEVSVTSTAEYETQNILKCLSAGYTQTFVVVSNQKKIPALNSRLSEAIPLELKEKVKVFSLSGLLGHLREIAFPKPEGLKSEKPSGQRLDITGASEFLGISPSTLYRWVREGRIPFYRVGREYRFDRDELVLIGKHDLSGKRKALVKLEPLKIGKAPPKSKKEQDKRYRKMLKLD